MPALNDCHARKECFCPSMHDGQGKWKEGDAAMLAELFSGAGGIAYIVPACSVFAKEDSLRSVCPHCHSVGKIKHPANPKCARCGKEVGFFSCFGFTKEKPELDQSVRKAWDLCIPYLEALFYAPTRNVGAACLWPLAATLAGEGLLQTGIPEDCHPSEVFNAGAVPMGDGDGGFKLWSLGGKEFGPNITKYGIEIIEARIGDAVRAERARKRIAALLSMDADDREACFLEAQAKLIRRKKKKKTRDSSAMTA